jgi:hypothetical protein
MIFEIIILTVLIVPIVYLIIWGWKNNKIRQYESQIKDVAKMWKKKKLSAVIKSKRDNQNLT